MSDPGVTTTGSGFCPSGALCSSMTPVTGEMSIRFVSITRRPSTLGGVVSRAPDTCGCGISVGFVSSFNPMRGRFLGLKTKATFAWFAEECTSRRLGLHNLLERVLDQVGLVFFHRDPKAPA